MTYRELVNIGEHIPPIPNARVYARPRVCGGRYYVHRCSLAHGKTLIQNDLTPVNIPLLCSLYVHLCSLFASLDVLEAPHLRTLASAALHDAVAVDHPIPKVGDKTA